MPSTTIPASAIEIIPQNLLRKSLTFQNEDTALNVFIKQENGKLLTVSATDHDFIVPPGGSISLNSEIDGYQSVQARWTGISSSGTPRISFFESEDIKR